MTIEYSAGCTSLLFSLPSTPWAFWTGILSKVSKNDDEKTLVLRVIWL